MTDRLAVDLYCGAGGVSLGLLQAGFRIGGAVDCDPVACATYERNLGIRPVPARLEELDPRDFMAACGLSCGIDLLVGCPPCQGFSQAAGNAAGESDPRNRQVEVFARWVRVLKPRAVVFENVPGILRRGGRYLAALLSALEDSGMQYTAAILNAADFGVPQRRKRLVVVASRSGRPRLPEPSWMPPATVRGAIGDLPPLAAGESDPADPEHRARPLGERILRLIRMIPRDGGSRTDLPRKYWMRCHLAGRGHEDVLGRLRWDAPSPTITAGCTDVTKGRFVHPEQDRGLTPREAACLQSFPRWYRFEGNVRQVSAQIGNAFPPLLMERIASLLARG
jgi:DNA (cytosine-5)-methyltransferase 1